MPVASTRRAASISRRESPSDAIASLWRFSSNAVASLMSVIAFVTACKVNSILLRPFRVLAVVQRRPDAEVIRIPEAQRIQHGPNAAAAISVVGIHPLRFVIVDAPHLP